MIADRKTLALAALSSVLLPAGAALAAGDPSGVWLNDTGRGAIEIKQCGDSLCGHVVWLRDTNDRKGCGRQIIGEAKQAGSGLWDGGWVYSPEKKRRYDVELKPLSDGSLRVKGYAGTKLFSKTMIWTKAPSDLQRCGETVAAVSEPAPVAKPDVVPDVVPAPVVKSEPVAKSEPAPTPAPVATPEAPKIVNPAPVEAAKSEPVPAAEPAPAPVDEASTEESDGGGEKIALGDILDKLSEIEKETGYGLKKTGDGTCRLKVPFATIKIKCED